jgi:hypothetical protein
VLALYRTRERDFWFHLAAGRSLLEHGIPSAERWCMAAHGQWPWLGEWLFHAAIYLVHAVAGDTGVGLWRAAWSALAVALVLALSRSAGAGTAATMLAVPLVLAVTRARLAARPEQITVAFVLLFLLLFERARRTGRDRTWWLIPVQIAWANLHPGWILGPLAAGLYGTLEMARGSAGDRRRALRWLVLGLTLYAAGAVSPRPLDTLSLRLVRDVHADPMMGTIEELKPWRWHEDRSQPFTGFLVLVVAAAALGGAGAWRASPPLTLAALVGLAGGLASYRFRALGTLIAMPVVASALEAAWPRDRAEGGPGVVSRRPRMRPIAFRLAHVAAALAALGGAVWLAADARYFPPGVAPLLDSVPVRAVAVADSLGLEGPVLNTSWFGGYLLWVRGERHLPLQDTRNLGTADFRSRLVRARLDPAALDSLLAHWDFTHAILEPPMDPADRMAVQLFHRAGWALVVSDDAGLLFVRGDRYPTAAATLGYHLLSPDYGELGGVATRALSDSALGRAFVAELERARADSPWNARANLWLGLLALARGEPSEALQDFDRVERLAPITPGLALRQGIAHERLGDVAGARRAYRRALADTGSSGAAREALARLGR